MRRRRSSNQRRTFRPRPRGTSGWLHAGRCRWWVRRVGARHVGFLAEHVVVGTPRPREHGAQVDESAHGPTHRDEGDGQSGEGVAHHHVVTGVGEGFDRGVGVLARTDLGVLAGQIDREDPMPAALQLGSEPAPASWPVIGAVYQPESGHRRGQSRRGLA